MTHYPDGKITTSVSSIPEVPFTGTYTVPNLTIKIPEVPIRCPGLCIKIDEKTGEHHKAYLSQVDKDKDRWFCTTSGCKFAFMDEHKIHHWVGGVVPTDLPTEDPIT